MPSITAINGGLRSQDRLRSTNLPQIVETVQDERPSEVSRDTFNMNESEDEGDGISPAKVVQDNEERKGNDLRDTQVERLDGLNISDGRSCSEKDEDLLLNSNRPSEVMLFDDVEEENGLIFRRTESEP